MRRDIGNELVVAIAAVGVLAFALIFGVILSLSNTPPGETPTATIQATESNEDIPTLNPTEMSEILQQGTQVVALLTASAQAEASESPTRTPRPTDIEEPTETNTAIPTLTPRSTDTVAPSDTPTRTPTSEPTDTLPPTPNVSETFESLRATATAFAAVTEEVPASDTPTRTTRPTDEPTLTPSQTRTQVSVALAATNEPTDTPVPPTATHTPSPTVTPSSTAVPPTNTLPPTPNVSETFESLRTTATAFAAITEEPSDTPTAMHTASFTMTPSPTWTPTATETFVLPTAIVLEGNVPIPTVLVIGTPEERGECTLPPGWTTYVVQRGDTLFRIALAVGSTVGELRDANCLQNVDNIYAETTLFVPRAPTRPVQPAGTVVSTSGAPAVPQGCTYPGAQITAPQHGQVVTGVITLFGTATVPNFQYYRIEVRPDFSNVYNFYDRIETPVENNALAQINTDLFDDGLHWVRLTVVDNTGNFPEPCAIPLIFR